MGVSTIGVAMAAPAIHNARKKRDIVEKHLNKHYTTHVTRKRDVLGGVAISGTIGVVTLGVGTMGADAIAAQGAEHGIAAIVENDLAIKVVTHAALDGVGMGIEHAHTSHLKKKDAHKAFQAAGVFQAVQDAKATEAGYGYSPYGYNQAYDPQNHANTAAASSSQLYFPPPPPPYRPSSSMSNIPGPLPPGNYGEQPGLAPVTYSYTGQPQQHYPPPLSDTEKGYQTAPSIISPPPSYASPPVSTAFDMKAMGESLPAPTNIYTDTTQHQFQQPEGYPPPNPQYTYPSGLPTTPNELPLGSVPPVEQPGYSQSYSIPPPPPPPPPQFQPSHYHPGQGQLPPTPSTMSDTSSIRRFSVMDTPIHTPVPTQREHRHSIAQSTMYYTPPPPPQAPLATTNHYYTTPSLARKPLPSFQEPQYEPVGIPQAYTSHPRPQSQLFPPTPLSLPASPLDHSQSHIANMSYFPPPTPAGHPSKVIQPRYQVPQLYGAPNAPYTPGPTPGLTAGMPGQQFFS